MRWYGERSKKCSNKGFMSLISRAKSFINSGSERSRLVKRNAAGSLLVKFFSMFIDFAKVPILLSYLDSEHYGVYITIASIIYWSHNFDFGLGAGLRYNLTKAVSLGATERGKRLVSTAYISMSGIVGIVFICSVPIFCHIDWNSILNCSVVSSSELLYSVITVLTAYLIQFVLELLSYVLQADQRTAISSIFKPIANLITLVLICVLKQFSYNSLFLACLAMTVPIVLVLSIANIRLYYKKYNTIAPSIKCFDRSYLRDIYSLGLKFFLGQLSSLIVFNTGSFLITYYINPVETAAYNSAWTYFGILVVFNNMVLQPFVAAITDAYVKDDINWIKRTFSKIRLYSIGLTVLSLFLLFVSPLTFDLWLGDKLEIPRPMCVLMSIYFILNIWVSPYMNFISGVGKLSLTSILSIIKIIVFIPIAVLLIKLYGTTGLLIAIITINTIPNFILGISQYNKIINKSAKGIWNR